MSYKNILVIIPAYNEERAIKTVIESLKLKGYNNILVIDDGSKDKTFEVAKSLNVYVARHLFNRGLGSALATGFEIAKYIDPDIIVTFDADGQHDIKDIKSLIDIIQDDKADVVIGTRLLDKKGMPLKRVLYNKIANIITMLVYGFSVSDTQSGLRAFNRKSYNILNIETSKMECSSEIIYKIKKIGLRVGEVKIKPIYTDYSLSKGQGIRTGIKTFIRLVLNRLSGMD